MRNKLTWGKAHYILHLKDEQGINTVIERARASCFSGYLRLPVEDLVKVYKIKFLNISCKETQDYYNFYLNYIIDMLKIEATYDEDSFEFTTFKCKYKNLLVLSLVRVLHEPICNVKPNTVNVEFLELLKNVKSKYRNKLKRFCDFYSRLKPAGYITTGHIWKPSDTKIKSTQDFLKTNSLTSVNIFFTNG